jgi:hypothetical protein
LATKCRWASKRFEPREQDVQGVPEFLELVLRAVKGQPLVQAGGGDPPRRTGDGPDGSQHPAGLYPSMRAARLSPTEALRTV